MIRFVVLLVLEGFSGGAVFAQEFPREARYVQRSIQSPSGPVEMHLVYFHTRAFRLEVVDRELSGGGSLAEIFAERGCVAGVNGGFFLKDQTPSGLMISAGQRTGNWGTAKLLSGVIYADGDGIHLLRRAEFQDHGGITSLVQAGPFLVDRGADVRGLSESPARRRTFVATDYRGHWVLGVAEAVSLADLGAALATPRALEFPVNRALNLDGGTSSGIYVDRLDGERDVVMTPFKRVRNYLGIAPR